MQRLIASSLLVVFLAGIFAPAAMALSQDPPHACCLRKASHCQGVQAEPALSSGGCAQHSCCRALAVRQWAQAALSLTLGEKTTAERRTSVLDSPLQRSEIADCHSGRAPPISLIA
jgi:hypothetical protein